MGAGVRRHIGQAVSAALMAIATSAVVPCWNRPTTSRVSAGLRLSNVSPDVESHPLPGDEVAEGRASRRRSRSCRRRGSARSDALERPSRPTRRHRGTAWRGRSGPRGGCSSWSSVATIRAPLAPIGWPSAIAPPLTLTFDPVEAELAAVGQRLGGERLVDLDEVERLDRHLDPVEQAADALDRGEEQPLRLDLGLGVADDPGQRLQAEPLDGPFAGDDGRRGAVGDARRVAGRDRALRRVAAVLAARAGRRRA